MEREVVVRGIGHVRAVPDRATVRVVIDGEGAERDEAYAAAAQVAAAVDEVLDGAGEAIGRVVTATLVVQPKTRWRKGESIRTGWTASRTSIVEVLDLDALGALLAKLTGAGGAIYGPSWELDEGHAGHGEARRRAALDARSRAEAYSSSLGLTLGPVAWVAEPGLRKGAGDDDHRAFLVQPAMAGGATRGASEDTIDVSPQEMTIEATVEVGFSIA